MKSFEKRMAVPAHAVSAALKPRKGAATNSGMSFLPTRRPLVLIGALLIASAAVAGCSSKGNVIDPGNTEGACKTGVNAPFATPAGTPFVLPAGVVLEGGEMTSNVDPNCPGTSFIEYGSDIISICVGLRNNGTAPALVTIPAGAVFLAKEATSANAIVLQSHDLTVPAGGVAYFYFRPFSLNANCGYSVKTDRYTFGNVVSDAKLVELIGLAKKKSLATSSDAHEVLQPSVWDITDGDGLTTEHRNQIAALPDAN
jgi:hypothetical protein